MDGMMPEFHAPAPPQPQTSAQYFFTPLMISMACMFATFFAIVTYHFLVVNFCVGRRHSQAVANLLARRRSAAAWDRDSPVGVEEKVLRRIPILSYTVNPKLGSSGFRSDGECVVCLGEMEEGAAVRVLPNCRHVFHVACIDRWFLAHSSCPVCRSPVVPPPDHQVEYSPTTEPASGHGGRQLRRLSSAGTGLLRHAVSIVFPMELENKLPRGERLRRSVSMDVVINVSTVGSSSFNNVVASASSDLESGGSRSNNARNSNMDASLSSSKLTRIRSFTQLRIHDVEAAAVTVV